MLSIDISRLIGVFSYDSQAPMIFSSGFFLWLFTAFISVYVLLTQKNTARILFVTAFSYFFYYKSSGVYFLLLALVTVSDFFLAQRMNVTASAVQRKLLVFFSLLINLGLLCYFKYSNFFGTILADITGGSFSPIDVFLPVGISFFTFQSLSYTIDVYRKQIEPLNHLMDYAFYVSFFPQLVAGPIVRARDFIPQIRKPLMVTSEMFGRGVFLILCGLFKKSVISDYISVNFVERVFDAPSLYSGVENLVAVYGYALQIYCDFSGYSDMAIGIALLLGFHFNLNFDSPYKSLSITEFWRRWHISLSSWLRDYLYISLGGNRKGKLRQYVNLIVTMFLGGLWHGASWNFVLWGVLHGLALAVHKIWLELLAVSRLSIKIPNFVGAFLTFHFVCFCWIFFRNTSFENSLNMIRQIFVNFHVDVLPQMIIGYWPVFVLMMIGFLLHFAPDDWEKACCSFITRIPLWAKALIIILVVFVIIQVKSADIQPFIYFQF